MKKLLILALAFLMACGEKEKDYNSKEKITTEANPAAEGFNKAGSDPEAISIADSVMEAMGGRKTWDTTRIIMWNFFGRRDLLWNKSTGDVRIETPYDSMVYLVNVHENKGRVFKNGEEITAPDSLKKFIQKAKSIWINDSYWLVMPFKLKDSGVTLKYLKKDTLPDGNPAHVLQLTFDSVGDTPQNKYEVYVDEKENLVKQWAYFADSKQAQPTAVWPWDNYQEINGLMLSFNRSDGKGPADVKIFTAIDSQAFISPNWSYFEKQQTD